jgi:hypothetical protein
LENIKSGIHHKSLPVDRNTILNDIFHSILKQKFTKKKIEKFKSWEGKILKKEAAD